MDNRVDIGEVDIQNGIAPYKAVMEFLALFGNCDLALCVHNGPKSGNIPCGSQESVRVSIGQSTAANGGDTVLNLAFVCHHTTAADNTDAVRSGIPCADNDLLGAVHFPHKLAENEGAAVVGQDVNDLTIFQQGNQFTENILVSNGDGSYNDDARALDSLCHIVGSQSDFHGTLALIAEEAELRAAQGNAGLLNVGEVDFRETGLVPETDFLALQRTVSGHGFAYRARTQNGDRHILQVAHVHSNVLLVMISIGFAVP